MPLAPEDGGPGGVGLKATPVPSIQSIQIDGAAGLEPDTVELSVGAEIAAQSSIRSDGEFVSTLAIPSDVGDLSQSAQLRMCRFDGPGRSARCLRQRWHRLPVRFEPGQTRLLADQLLNGLRSEPHWADGTRDGGCRIETGEGGELSLVLQSSAGPITVDDQFREYCSKASPALRQINIVPQIRISPHPERDA